MLGLQQLNQLSKPRSIKICILQYLAKLDKVVGLSLLWNVLQKHAHLQVFSCLKTFTKFHHVVVVEGSVLPNFIMNTACVKASNAM